MKGIGFHLMKGEVKNQELLQTISNFESDTAIIEKIGLFVEVFKMKDDS